MILVLLDVRLGTDGGSHLFGDLLGLLQGTRDVVVLTDDRWGPFGNLLKRICFNRYVRYAKRRSEFACRVYLWLYYRLFARVVKRKLREAYASAGVGQIWSVSNEILPAIATGLAKEFECPIHVSIHDLPFTYELADGERRMLRAEMKGWLSQLSSWDVQSPGMQEELKNDLPPGGSGIVIWGSAGIAAPDPRPSTTRPALESIAFCGSLRFRREFEALVDAVTLLNESRERPIEIRLYASKPHPAPVVNWRGYLDKEALIAELRDADLAYSPLGFEPDDRLLVETSFPSKIATYLRAGVPILAHAPASATNAIFVVENEIGIAISTLEPRRIAVALLAYESNSSLRGSHAANTRAALIRHFSADARRDFFGAFGKQRTARAIHLDSVSTRV